MRRPFLQRVEILQMGYEPRSCWIEPSRVQDIYPSGLANTVNRGSGIVLLYLRVNMGGHISHISFSH